MLKTEKFLAAVQAAGKNGVATSVLQKELGGNLQTVHTTAWTLRKQGVKLKNVHGAYVLIGNHSNVPAVVSQANSHQPSTMPIAMGLVAPEILEGMDHSSKLDLIEQVRRSQLHLDIARAIVGSFKMANSLKEKI